jgi:16S rRNA (cytidine1402-2'-O)-methyltransferase
MLGEVAALAATLVLYESPRRTADTLALLAEVLGDRRACVARELTKLHEEVLRDRLTGLAAALGAREVLGEVVIVVEGRPESPRWSEEEVTGALRAGLERGERLKAMASDLARLSGWTSQAVYRLGLQLRPR